MWYLLKRGRQEKGGRGNRGSSSVSSAGEKKGKRTEVPVRKKRKLRAFPKGDYDRELAGGKSKEKKKRK